MTLKDSFDLLATQPVYVLAYFIAIPFTALLFNVFSRNDAHLSPWKQAYGFLIYLVSLPGIFSIALTIYLFLFERRSILQSDIYVQIVPVLSIFVTYWIVTAKLSLRNIPGTGRLFGLMAMIMSSFAIMWVIDSTRIIAFTYIPFHYMLGAFLGFWLVMCLGWRMWFGGAKKAE